MNQDPAAGIMVKKDADVELLVNGASLGRKTGANGVFLWENVELKRGVNALEARSDTSIDYADIRVL